MKIKLLTVLVFVLISYSFVSSIDIDALSCGLAPFSESFDKHDLLLHGTLIDKQPSGKRGLAGQTTQLTFDAIKVYKGDFQETFVINADLAHDDIYRIGIDYVIFADRTEDGYLRDLCVPNYISSDEIIMFLDDYITFPLVGIGVHSLYDVVEFPKRYDLDLKMSTYIDLNRGKKFLERSQQDMTKIYSCDFAEALTNPVKYDSHNRMVSNFMKDNPSYATDISSNLDSNPQMGEITYVGENEILEESVINAKVIGNCFFVYDIKIIDKDTEKVTAHLNSKEGVCMAENSHELFPDFCSNNVQEFPNNKDDLSTSYSQQWIIKAILAVIIVGGIVVGIIIAIKLWRKRK